MKYTGIPFGMWVQKERVTDDEEERDLSFP